MDIQLAPLTEGPIYLQVRTQIDARIRSGQLKAGESLPAPSALAQKLSVDRGEIQRAYFELEQSGLVVKKTVKDFLGKEKSTYQVK